MTGPPWVVLDTTFRALLQRPPDAHACQTYLEPLKTGAMSVEQLGRRIIESDEFKVKSASTDMWLSLHRSRCDFVRGLPPARRILDLGGSHLGHDFGALVMMGYPYPFDELVIVDLPPEQRHDIYRSGGVHPAVDCGRGTVRYEYHSMLDLSAYHASNFDLVYCGEAIEHVKFDEADTVLAEVQRVLRPGGWFALDTPNARLTRLWSEDFIDGDHKYEYQVGEMRAKLDAAGFRVVETKGLNLGVELLRRDSSRYPVFRSEPRNDSRPRRKAEPPATMPPATMPPAAMPPAMSEPVGEAGAGGARAEGDVLRDFSSEIAKNAGLFADVESCFLMAFLCQSPG